MATMVTITNLKSIKNPEFGVPQKGAFTITGASGRGKIPLQNVLHWIDAPNVPQLEPQGRQALTGTDGITATTIPGHRQTAGDCPLRSLAIPKLTEWWTSSCLVRGADKLGQSQRAIKFITVCTVKGQGRFVANPTRILIATRRKATLPESLQKDKHRAGSTLQSGSPLSTTNI